MSSKLPPTRRTRDAERTRASILDAAEHLFAERGFDGTSMQDIGDAAGCSRGTPGYFFGSKDGLYRAVLDRALEIRTQAATAGGGESGLEGEPDPRNAIRATIAAYYDALVAGPDFVRLMEREALAGGRFLRESETHERGVRTGLSSLRRELKRAGLDDVDPPQLMLSVMAMCWFPLVHRPLAEALGLDPDEPGFHQRRKEHVTELVLAALI